VPVGPHIVDVVSFPLRAVIELLPADESAEAGKMRAERRAWLIARDYRVLGVRMDAVDADASAVLDGLAGALDLGAPVP
jgi:tRNA/rRNA methyltransferase